MYKLNQTYHNLFNLSKKIRQMFNEMETICHAVWNLEWVRYCCVTPREKNFNSNMTSFKRFESKPVVKIILIYDRLNLWRHREFITIFYQFLHIRIKIIHGSHMYILFLPRVGLYVSFLPLANARGKTSWHEGLPVVKTIYTYGFHELFLNYIMVITSFCWDDNKACFVLDQSIDLWFYSATFTRTQYLDCELVFTLSP